MRARHLHQHDQGDGNPVADVRGRADRGVPCLEPEALWAALNADNKVSLYANVNGEVTIFNKNL